MRHRLFYQPFEFVPAKGKEPAHYKRTTTTGSILTSVGKIYQVQPDGSLKRVDKTPSRRDLHRMEVKKAKKR